MSILITASGRLAATPELELVGDSNVCNFRLLSNRWTSKGEVIEAVRFVVWNTKAEAFCSRAVKGQIVEATGVQETNHYTDERTGEAKSVTRYRLTWFNLGPKPRPGNEDDAGMHRSQSPTNRPAADSPINDEASKKPQSHDNFY